MSWSSMVSWDHSVPRGGTAMDWNLSDQSSSSKTSDGNTYSIGSPGVMSLGGYSPVNYENSCTTNYVGAAFNSAVLNNPSSSSSQHPHSQNNDNTRATPTSLGWTPDTQLWKVYKFVVIKGKQPYLELLPGCNVTYQTPERVFLDPPSRQQKKGKQSFPCQFPGGCNGKQTVFTRPADLERHYIQVHASINDRPSFKCDYGPCQRAKERPFTRKDHYRDHLRDYHKEDLGPAKGEKNFRGGKLGERQEVQERWLAERKISSKWWRCPRCLVKVYVRENGWDCNECKGVCEPERRDARQRLVKDAAVVETATSYTSNCSTCNGTAWIESAYLLGTWDACPNCQPSAAGEYDVTGTQYSSSSYY